MPPEHKKTPAATICGTKGGFPPIPGPESGQPARRCELAGTNIFPGELLLKNFGVTRYERVLFRDHDEIAPITECTFRRLPSDDSDDDEGSYGEPLVLGRPERHLLRGVREVPLPPEGEGRDFFLRENADIAGPEFWLATQERIRAGIQDDVFPYAQDIRFKNRPTLSQPAAPAERRL